jgi:hypothetical protein
MYKQNASLSKRVIEKGYFGRVDQGYFQLKVNKFIQVTQKKQASNALIFVSLNLFAGKLCIPPVKSEQVGQFPGQFP